MSEQKQWQAAARDNELFVLIELKNPSKDFGIKFIAI
jgi:hypothetical protein